MDDLRFLSPVLQEFLLDPQRREDDVARNVSSFFKLCKALEAPDEAREMWNFCYKPAEGQQLSLLTPSQNTKSR